VEKGVGVWVKSYGGCGVLWSFCVFGYISVVVVNDDCRGLGLCAVGTVGNSADDDCGGGRSSVVTGWGRMGGGGKDTGKEWMRRGRKSIWEGGEWIVVPKKEGE
jgi:hypothetical protein